MSNNKQKLELTWVGKNNPEHDIANIEPRILEERADLSYGDKDTENMIIHGDNLLALKALLPEYEGKVKCIYIDPPYNTGSLGFPYDDNVEHSLWLSLMRSRLELFYTLLADNGAIFIQIDQVEFAYLNVLMDEIYGRNNRINIITIKTKLAGVSGSHVGKSLQDNSEYIIAYAKNKGAFEFCDKLSKKKELIKFIKEMESDGKSWKYTSVLESIDEGDYVKTILDGYGDPIKIYKHTNYSIKSIKQVASEKYVGDLKKAYYGEIDNIFRTTNAQSSIRTKIMEETNSIESDFVSIEYVPRTGRNKGTKIRLYYKGKIRNLVAMLRDVVRKEDLSIFKIDSVGTIWDDIQYNNLTKEGDVLFPNGKKPELLVQNVIRLASNKADLILDSFLGSGTTAAVAHKMGRKYIGIEMGEHAYTHCKVRLDKVVDGSDQGGISKAVEWKGGGGYKFYELAPSFVVIDEFGNPVIDSYYNDIKLIRAMCKLTNYTFAPSASDYWKHGKGQGNNSVYVTTAMLSVAMVQQIVSHLVTNETLLICPKKFEPGCEKVDARITIKKIPQSILKACQFGKKEYLLPIKERAMEEIDEDDSDEN